MRIRLWWLILPVMLVAYSILASQAQQQPSAKPELEKRVSGTEVSKAPPLYRIQVEDAIEAALIEQELAIKPVMVRGQAFYYHGDDKANARLREFGYEPVWVDGDEILSRVVRVRQKGSEAALRDLGVRVILREKLYWVVRATPKQLRLLARLGYRVEELGQKEPRPRQIRLVVASVSKVEEVGSLKVDIYNVQRTEKGYVIHGGAFDDAIDELRRRGFVVDILPDPPGVTR